MPDPVQTAMDTIQGAFDRALPTKGPLPAAAPITPTPPATAPETTPDLHQSVVPEDNIESEADFRAAEAAKATEATPTATEPKKPAGDVPSFIEDILNGEKPSETPKPTEHEGEWPEELPEVKTKEESKERWKNFRSSYQKLKAKNADLETKLNSRPANGLDETTSARFTQLEKENKEMSAVLARVGVEQHADFQNNVMRPLHAAWNNAAQVVKDSGGNPNDLARAVGLSGKAHFEAMDALTENWSTSAKIELQESLRDYRRLNGIRQNAIANAPKTMEALRQKDMAEQYQILEQQKSQLTQDFDDAVKALRDDFKFEVLQTGNGEDEAVKKWNENAEKIVSTARKVMFENRDMKKAMMLAVLGCSADSLRQLWLKAEARARKAEAINARKFGNEPTISTGEDNGPTPQTRREQDLKRPFIDVFVEARNASASGHRL